MFPLKNRILLKCKMLNGLVIHRYRQICPVALRRRGHVQHHTEWRIQLLVRQNMAVQSCRGQLFSNNLKGEDEVKGEIKPCNR